jgi:hypothetical protein
MAHLLSDGKPVGIEYPITASQSKKSVKLCYSPEALHFFFSAQIPFELSVHAVSDPSGLSEKGQQIDPAQAYGSVDDP